ncbi:MAG: tetratricopeptide repeat protein [Methanothrix sp.]|jgi:tetratricopeptide (TPR) repeat protein|nr:tetratricopeptide repeat protein [Methanothrix sp.]
MKVKAVLILLSLVVLCSYSVAQAQENTTGYWLKKGYELSPNGSNEQALQAYEKALVTSDQVLEKNPKNASVLRVKAEALTRLGRWDESRKILENVIEINPKNYDAIGRKGELLFMMGRFNESLKAFNQAIELIPANDTLELVAYRSAKSEVLKIVEQDILENPENAKAWEGKRRALQLAKTLGYQE